MISLYSRNSYISRKPCTVTRSLPLVPLMVGLIGLSLPAYGQETIRIAAVSLKNFGDSRASDPHKLEFIADRIAEQAVKGVCVVDELQDADGSAMEQLHEAVSLAAYTFIAMELSERVGEGREEQFGFFYNPLLVDLTDLDTVLTDEIERDPGVADFKAVGGFDFTLCAFHLPPDSRPDDLEDEVVFLDNLFEIVQDLDPDQDDIILLGDFNAPPNPLPDFGQDDITLATDLLAAVPSIGFVITDKPTNVKNHRVYDNIVFDTSETTEYVPGVQHVVRLEELLDEFTGEIPSDDPVDWFNDNVMDHCPIYAVFRADLDTD